MSDEDVRRLPTQGGAAVRSGCAGSSGCIPPSGRRGFSLMEVVIASGIFLLCAGYALSTLWYNRKASDTTGRVGNLQEVRRVLTRIHQDLQAAVALESPGWDSVAGQVAYLDDEYRRITFFAADSGGAPLDEAAMEALPASAEVRLLRKEEVVGQPPEVDRVDRGLRIRRLRFFRLGRSLLGFRMELGGDPDASTEALRRPEVFSTVVALNRQVH